MTTPDEMVQRANGLLAQAAACEDRDEMHTFIMLAQVEITAALYRLLANALTAFRTMGLPI